MRATRFTSMLAGALGCLAGMPAGAQLGAQTTGACAGIKGCMETRDIVATVTDFRSSLGGSNVHILTATVRFTNKSTKPLILGYVNSSGIATDDQGNRYGILSNASIRGIGVINGNRVDTKFSLQPGESADTRFELGWRPSANKIYGTSYTLEMTVREVDPINASQLRLGEEYALRFPGLTGDGQGLANGPATTAATGVAVATGTAVAPSVAVAPVAQVVSNACANVARCYDAGNFSAVVTSMIGSMSGSTHVVDATVRFTNNTNQPLILAYTYTSGAMIDNLGNRYRWGRPGAPDKSFSGIGTVTRSKADPQFALRPGESRDAKFILYRYNAGKNAIGSSFNYDVSIEQLEILASRQVRSVRQYAVHFDNLPLGGTTPNVTDALDKLKSLFGHKKP